MWTISCFDGSEVIIVYLTLPVRLPLGLAPSIAKFTFAFLPSIMGFGSFKALSAASLFAMIT